MSYQAIYIYLRLALLVLVKAVSLDSRITNRKRIILCASTLIVLSLPLHLLRFIFFFGLCRKNKNVET